MPGIAKLRVGAQVIEWALIGCPSERFSTELYAMFESGPVTNREVVMGHRSLFPNTVEICTLLGITIYEVVCGKSLSCPGRAQCSS